MTTSVGKEPKRCKLQDMDGDDLPEAIVHNISDGTISVCTNGGGISFTTCQTLSTANGLDASVEPVIGDIDGDTDLDIVAVAVSGRTFLNDGAGSFAQDTDFSLSSGIESAALGDMDGDMDKDLVVLHGGSFDILINPGDGKFDSDTGLLTYTIAGQQEPRHVALTDFNQDGSLDVLITMQDQEEVWALANDGSGLFDSSSAVKIVLSGLGCVDPSAFATGDFDLDGDDDLAVSCSGSDSAVLLRQGPSSIAPFPYMLPMGSKPWCIGAGDFDKNGSLDIATINYDGRNISVLLNKLRQ